MPSVTPNPDVTFKIRHQDEDVLVVDKPAWRVTQPGKGHDTDTLLNGLFALFGDALQNLGAKRDFGLLHRLDRQTSGLVVVALRARAYDVLRDDFARRRVAKFYWAVCAKAPRSERGLVRAAIAETMPRAGTADQKLARLAPPPAGKPAVTAYRVLARSDLGALIQARPLTGRLHQVRVHLDRIGAPILGDDLYAPNPVARAWHRLALHAHRLVFTHPVTGAPTQVDSPFPRDLRTLLTRLRLPRPDEAPPPAGDGAQAPEHNAAETDEFDGPGGPGDDEVAAD